MRFVIVKKWRAITPQNVQSTESSIGSTRGSETMDIHAGGGVADAAAHVLTLSVGRAVKRIQSLYPCGRLVAPSQSFEVRDRRGR